MANETKYASLGNLQTFKANADRTYALKSEIGNIDPSAYETTENAQSKYNEIIAHSDENLETAKEYTNTKTANLITSSEVETKISTHNTSTSAHDDIRALVSGLSDKLTKFLNVDDTTTDELSEVLQLIEDNKGTLESLTTSKINVADIVDNLTTNVSSKVLSAAQGVVIKELIDALQDELDVHTHTITANATNDNIIILTGTNGVNSVTYSASHADSTVTEGTYKSVTVDRKGHVISGTNPTSLSGYGITDAYNKDEIDVELAKKSNTEHTHVASEVTDLQTLLDAKVSVTTTVNGKALDDNIELSASDINAYTKEEIDVLELITVNDIDVICGSSIQAAEQVMF